MMIRTHRPRRRGVSTLWLLLTLPVFLTLLAFTVNIANLWLARVELENSLEAAALAAVREWGEGSSTDAAKDVAIAYAAANPVRGIVPASNFVFGEIEETGGKLTFDPLGTPVCDPELDDFSGDFGVRVQATVPVSSLRALLGNSIGPYSVTATVTARYNCDEKRAWLVRVDQVLP
jgi:Flp pilus assembly protein TadG